MLLAIKNSIPCKIVASLHINRCDCLVVDVMDSGSEFTRYCLVYRPPDTNIMDSIELYNVIFDHLKNTKAYVLFGDFNLPDISWKDLTARLGVSREFLSLCYKFGANQLVDFPTRLDKQLDLILCPDKNALESIYCEAPFCDSDHVSIFCHVYKSAKKEEHVVYKPCFKRADYALINAFLATIDWDIVYANCHSMTDHW